jgi:hypothetical protein
VSHEDRIARLERGIKGLIARLEGLPDQALYQAPAAGEWPVMSTLAHVAEMLPYWAHQCERVARTPGAAFGRTHDDPGRLAAIAEHGMAATLSVSSVSRCGPVWRKRSPRCARFQMVHGMPLENTRAAAI